MIAYRLFGRRQFEKQYHVLLPDEEVPRTL